MTEEKNEPMYLVEESDNQKWLELDYSAKDIVNEIRARGPVHSGAQQQAPVIFEGQSRFACPFQNGCEDGDGFCEYPCEKWLDWHDASIAAQARKEGYAEGAAQAIERIPDIQPIETLQNLIRTLNLHGEANVAVEVLKAHERAKEHDAQTAAAERGRVLKKMCEQCPVREEIPTDDPRCAESCEGCLARMVCGESLRSQPEKHPEYCKHLKWLNQVEGGGEYRCELGNETSDEWCYTKERCGDYELVPECGACTGPDPLDDGETFMKAIERRIEFCQNLGYDCKNPILDALINLREQILIFADLCDKEELMQQDKGDVK